MQENEAGLSGFDSATASCEEFFPELFLEFIDGETHRRLADFEASRSFTHRAGLNGANKIAKLPKFQ